jgi:hypothetical protein
MTKFNKLLISYLRLTVNFHYCQSFFVTGILSERKFHTRQIGERFKFALCAIKRRQIRSKKRMSSDNKKYL